jgi:hypothetical protein
MNEMIDRVALAISGSDDPASILAIHRSRARLGIRAMREPTEEMRCAGEDCGSNAPVAIFNAMIDAALSDKSK